MVWRIFLENEIKELWVNFRKNEIEDINKNCLFKFQTKLQSSGKVSNKSSSW